MAGSFMKDYSFNLRWASYRDILLEVLLEDFIHWWVIRSFLTCFLDEHIVGWINSLLFALGHLGRNPLYSAQQLDFWTHKFPPMLVMGYVYFRVSGYNRLYTTLLHMVWNTFWLVIVGYFAPPEKPGDWLLQMAEYYERHPTAPPTEDENAIQRSEEREATTFRSVPGLGPERNDKEWQQELRQFSADIADIAKRHKSDINGVIRLQ